MKPNSLRAIKSTRFRSLAVQHLLFVVILILYSTCTFSANSLKMAVLQFGTANWELDVIKRHGLDKQQGFNLEVVKMAGKQATMVALQSGSVDLSVTDWIWVSRQRNSGKTFTFVPYSTALGAVVVPQGSEIKSIKELQGKKLGIAGGPLDKSWLLLQSLALLEYNIDLSKHLTPVFAAPPLLNQQLKQGRIDAVLNFWPYVARLLASDMHQLIAVQQISQKLGIESSVPFVGYVFDEKWAMNNPRLIDGFIRATNKAKQIMLESDQEWQLIRPLMKAQDEATFIALRDGFRAGIPKRWSKNELIDANRLFDILLKSGGKKLVGHTGRLAQGTFWQNPAE